MKFEPIAITGMSAIFPGGKDKREVWQVIMEGRDCVTEVPPAHWLVEDYYDPDPRATDKIYCSRGGFLPKVPFDAAAFGIPPSVLPATDISQILALIVADRVIADAEANSRTALDRENTSIFVGFSGATNLVSHMSARMARPVWVKAMRESGMPESEIDALCERILEHYVPWQENTFPGVLPNLVAGRIANRLDLGGTNCTVDAACGSSLAAVQAAVNELHLGRSSTALAGSVDTQNSHMGFACFAKTGVLSPTGDCRPFSADADGTVLAEGAAMVVLRRLADAERDGDRIYAVLRGLGSSSDGRSRSVYAPRPAGQSRALRRAYEMAGYGPDTVGLLEAHGTGTDAGDIGEFKAARKVFDESGRTSRQWCALGTVKSQFGHAKGAAGMAALFRGVMALSHKVLPPTIKVSEPHPRLSIEDSPFYLNTVTRPWWHSAPHPRRVGVSAFGFGGSNFHATLEEYDKGSVRLRALPAEVVPFAAESDEGLKQRCDAVLQRIRCENPPSLQAVAWAQVAELEAGAPVRLALVATSIEELEGQLAKVIADSAPAAGATSPKIHYGRATTTPRVAFLFPGQASQRVSMGQELAMAFPSFHEVWAGAGGELLDGESSLLDVVFPRPTSDPKERQAQAERLMDTRWAQPAMGVGSMAYLALLESCGVVADCLAGHSYGELSALAAGGALARDELVRISRQRGELMAAAGGGTGMTAIHADPETVAGLLDGVPGVVLANQNGPGQSVVAGAIEELEVVEARCRDRQVRHTRLKVSAAFHSPHMEPAAERFRAVLDQSRLGAASVPVYRNDGRSAFADDPGEIAGQLAEQLVQPVRFSDMIAGMAGAGVDLFVEVGPGQVLTGLVRRLHGDASAAPRAVSLDAFAGSDLTGFLVALAELYAAGVNVRFDALWEGYDREELAAERSSRSGYVVHVDGCNYGNPYPPKGGAAALPPPQPERPAVPQRSASPELPASEVPATDVPAWEVPAPARPVLTGSPSANGAVDPGWMAALLAVQEQTARAQKTFQEAMANSHEQFLAATQRGMEGMLAAAQGVAPVFARGGSVMAPAPAVLPAPGLSAPVGQVALVVPVAPSLGEGEAGQAPVEQAPTAEALGSGVGFTAEQIANRVLELVSESTGYPVDVLDLETEMEAGLGIDSIKRVEILSRLQEEIPFLEDLEMGDVVGLASIGDIIDYIERSVRSGSTSGASPAVAPAESANGSEDPAVGAVPDAEELGQKVLAIVSGLTGYPVEVLDLETEMEAGLGIDSIKRMEILSELQQQVPGIENLDVNEVVGLKSLGDIIDSIRGTSRSGSEGATSSAAGVPGFGAPRRVPRPVPAGLGVAHDRLQKVERLMLLASGSGPDREVAEAMVRMLSERAIDVRVGSEVVDGSDGLIVLTGLRDFELPEEALQVQREAFRQARKFAQQPARHLFVTVQDTGGGFCHRDACELRSWMGGLAGLAKTASHEWEPCEVLAVDLERADRSAAELARVLVAELGHLSAHLEVGLPASGERCEVVEEVVAGERVDPAASPLPGEPVLIVSGGGRGITAHVLRELARHGRPRVVILGRTRLVDEDPAWRDAEDEAALKSALVHRAQAAGKPVDLVAIGAQVRRILAVREIRANLQELTGAGLEVSYHSVDLRSAAEVEAAVAEARQRWGRIDGILHAAGVIADKVIAEKTDAQFDSVFDTKVVGLQNLLAATAADALRFLVLFSSVAARYGNAGQCDYAMANEVLNRVAWAQRRQRDAGCLVKSLGWGPWDAGMVGRELGKLLRQNGVPLIGPDEGGRLFCEELFAADPSVVEVLLCGSADA